MSVQISRENIRTKVWKAIAKGEIDISTLPEEDLERLVAIVIDASILEIDDQITESEAADTTAEKQYYSGSDSDGEKLLWKGRPFLSISEHYMITDERVRVIKGILGKDKEDIELIRIQDIDQTQTLRERAFSVGDIVIHSHDRSDPKVVLNNVRDPEAVHEILRRAVINSRKAHNISFQEEM